jgi:hypothetical protein
LENTHRELRIYLKEKNQNTSKKMSESVNRLTEIRGHKDISI